MFKLKSKGLFGIKRNILTSRVFSTDFHLNPRKAVERTYLVKTTVVGGVVALVRACTVFAPIRGSTIFVETDSFDDEIVEAISTGFGAFVVIVVVAVVVVVMVVVDDGTSVMGTAFGDGA